MVAFVTSVLVSIALIGGGVLYAHHRPASQKGTWGEAMVGAIYVFLTLFWCFGVVPHQWIQYADSGLGWRVDKFFVGPGAILENLPFVIPYSAFRDIMVVNINVIYVITWAKMWALWQTRGNVEPVAAETITSDYGRPLVKADA